MALEKDFELLDDYLSNRLSEADKAALEQKIEADPDLQRELQFQKQLVEGIKTARVNALKGMLNNVPLSAIPGSQTSAAVKIGSAVVIGGIIITGLYIYFSGDDSTTENKIAQTEETTPAAPEESVSADTVSIATTVTEEPQPATTDKPASAPAKKETTTPKTPKLNVYDPTKDQEIEGLDAKEQIDIISHAFVTSSIQVETIEDRKYSFHYVFKDKKLLLYGIQESDLYEILEFIYDEKRTVFLFYKDNYYWLDISKSEPTRLIPIKDRALLGKLKEYRSN